MSSHSQALFDQATEQLRLAQAALEEGRYGDCDKLGYEASETIAAGYMAHLNNAPAIPSDETFEKFASHIWNAGSTSEAMWDACGIVGDVKVLREAHEWSLPDEISKADAELMANYAGRLLSIIRCHMIAPCSSMAAGS